MILLLEHFIIHHTNQERVNMNIITNNQTRAYELLSDANFSRSQWDYIAEINGWYNFRNKLSEQIFSLSDNTLLIQKGLNEKGGRV